MRIVNIINLAIKRITDEEDISMKGLLLDNWTIEKIVQCANDNGQPFSPEVMAFVEILVLWDNVYYYENGYSTYWQEHSVIDGFDIKRILKPIPLENTVSSLRIAETEYYEKFCDTYTSLVAKGALEYMYIASNAGLSYMPFGSRAKFIRENNLYLELRQHYDRYDAIHEIDESVLKYYDKLNKTVRKADISFNPNILFSAINRRSASFSQMLQTAKEWSQDATVKEFKNWILKLEDDTSNYRNIKITRYADELKKIEEKIFNNVKQYSGSISIGLPCSISLAINFPMIPDYSHILFPMSLYIDAISDDACYPASNEYL